MKKRSIIPIAGPGLGERYLGLGQTPGALSSASTTPLRGETVEEFVAFFYEFVRGDAAMVAVLDRALKARYPADE